MALSSHYDLVYQTRQFDTAPNTGQSPYNALDKPPVSGVAAVDAATEKARASSPADVSAKVAEVKKSLHSQRDLYRDVNDSQGILRDADGNVVSGAQDLQSGLRSSSAAAQLSVDVGGAPRDAKKTSAPSKAAKKRTTARKKATPRKKVGDTARHSATSQVTKTNTPEADNSTGSPVTTVAKKPDDK